MNEPRTKHHRADKEKLIKKDEEVISTTTEDEEAEEEYYRGDGTYISDTEQTKQEYGNTWD